MNRPIGRLMGELPLTYPDRFYRWHLGQLGLQIRSNLWPRPCSESSSCPWKTPLVAEDLGSFSRSLRSDAEDPGNRQPSGCCRYPSVRSAAPYRPLWSSSLVGISPPGPPRLDSVQVGQWPDQAERSPAGHESPAPVWVLASPEQVSIWVGPV